MAEETMDPGLLEQTKNQIRKLVSEIAELADSDIQPTEFHPEFLTRVVAAIAANGGALWLLDQGNKLKLQHQIELRQTGLLDPGNRIEPHNRLLMCMLQAAGPQIIPPGAEVEGVPGAGNPTPFALIIAPVVVDKAVVGLVEVVMDPSRRAAQQKSTLRFLGDLTDLAAGYLKNRQVRQMMSQQKLWNQLESFAHDAHGSLDLRETAYTIANEGKRLVGCDRLSVAIKVGGRLMIEAVSGQEVVEQRANLVREMTRLSKAVVQSGEDLVYTGSTDGLPPEIRDQLEVFIDESGSKALAAAILYKPEWAVNADPNSPAAKEKVPYGVLIAEQIGDEIAPTDMHARTEVVARHASTALWNASEHSKIFARPVLQAIGTPARFFRGRTLAKIGAALALVLTAIAAMAFVPWELTIDARGSLLPENRRTLFAPHQGVVKEVLVDHWVHVTKDQLLLRIESQELEKDRKKLVAEREDAYTRIQNLTTQQAKAQKPEDKLQLRGELEQSRIKLESVEEQLRILDEQHAMMEIRAPFDGIVTTWEVKKNLMNRPVDIGQELVQVADTDKEFVLEVDVADNDMAPILRARSKLEKAAAGQKAETAALTAWFVTATDPEHRYNGYVRRIAGKAETVEQKHVVKVTVGFDDSVRQDFLRRNQDFRPGAEVRARIKCGQAKLAYVLLRDVIHVWHETVLFRWPFLR